MWKVRKTLAEDGSQSERLLPDTSRLTACFAFDNNLNNTSSFNKRKASSPRTASPLSPYALRNLLSFVLIEILSINVRLHSAFKVNGHSEFLTNQNADC
uniref:AlNc14C401G11376 protein n=1 Tax=Albugo laibachii Nc14 TaxID=890382 RepID=F0WYW5_9STRA|nr:AlNc14C401G11376 [Albugo laibachii Nc14]|eukprot:CCA26678.1 AlNc14C401G11376 [Albugo laibachii Nc14]